MQPCIDSNIFAAAGASMIRKPSIVFPRNCPVEFSKNPSMLFMAISQSESIKRSTRCKGLPMFGKSVSSRTIESGGLYISLANSSIKSSVFISKASRAQLLERRT